MNRKIKIILFFLAGMTGYAKNIDDFISEYEKKSFTSKINEVNMKAFDIKDRLYDNREWNEVTLTSDTTYERKGSYNGVGIDTTVKYGWLYYKNGINMTEKEFTENKVGISKTINDYYFDENKYNKRINEINRSKQKITNEANKNAEIRDLIDLYKNYKNKEKEIEQGKITAEEKKKDFAIMAKKYELGTATRFDFNLSKSEYETSQLENDNLEKELKILGERFMIYNVVLPEKEKLEDLKKTELKKEDFYDIRLSEAENIKLSEALTEEEFKKEKFDYKYPKVTADAGYSFKNKSFTVGVGVTKTFKKYNDTFENLQNEAEKLKLEYEQKKNELISNVGQEMINYTTYQTNELIKEKAMNIAKEDYQIYAKKYELGLDTYSNYVEKRNVYSKAILEYEKAKNELAAFTKKIKYYK